MLNKWKAIQILQLSESGFTLKELKKQYRINALKYHPDKNLEDPDAASMKFQEIQSAYEYLTPYCISDSDMDEELDSEMTK
jgi:curved DNA-binding protein CbpA